MDAFDLEETTQRQQIGTALNITAKQLGDGFHDLGGGDSIAVNAAGDGPVTALPDVAPPAAAARKMIIGQDAGGGVTSRSGADPFDQEEARSTLRKAIAAGGDVLPALKRAKDLGAYDDVDQQLLTRRPTPTPDTTYVGGGKKGVLSEVTRPQFDRLRADWLDKYPGQPMPADLQTWQGFTKTSTDAGVATDRAADAARVAQVKREGSLNPQLNDPAAIAAARAGFQKTYGDAAPLPTQLTGTVEERSKAGFNNFVTYLRAKLPAEAGRLSDEEVFARFAEFEPLLGPKDAEFARGLFGEASAAVARGWTGLAKNTLAGGTGMLATAGAAALGDDNAVVRGMRRGETNFEDYYGRRGAESALLRPSDEIAGDGLHFDKWRWWVSSLAENSPQLAVSMATGGAAGALGKAAGYTDRGVKILANLAAFGSSATMEGTNAYGDIRQKLIASGMAPDQAAKRAAVAGAAVGIVNGALELIPFNEIVLKDKTGLKRLTQVATKIATAASKEGATEGIQEFVSILAEYGATGKFDQDAVKRVLESIAIGAALGGVTDAADIAGEKLHHKFGHAPADSVALHPAAPSPGTPGVPTAPLTPPGAGTPAAAVAGESGSNNPGAPPPGVNPGNSGALTGEEQGAQSADPGSTAGGTGTPAAGVDAAPALAESGTNNAGAGGGAAVGEGGPFAGVSDKELAIHVAEYNRLLSDDTMGPTRRDALETDLMTLLAEQAKRRGGAATVTPPPAEAIADPTLSEPLSDAPAALPEPLSDGQPDLRPHLPTAAELAAGQADEPTARVESTTTPAVEPTPAAAVPERNDRSAPERNATDHPATHDSAEAVGRWYGETFNDEPNASVIHAMLSMSEGKYHLADVPLSDIRQPVVSRNDKDPAKIDAISKLDAAGRASLPPAILFGGRQGKLDVADGAHRFNGLLRGGATSIRAYVPESWASRKTAAPQASADHTGQPATDNARANHDLGAAENAGEGEPAPTAPAKGAPRGADTRANEQGGARQSDTRGASAPRADDVKEGKESAETTSADPADWDFKTVFPKSVLDPADDVEADALGRLGFQVGDDGTITNEGAATVGTRDQLVRMMRARDGAMALAGGEVNPATGRKLTDKQKKGAVAEAERLDAKAGALLETYTTAFGDRAAGMLEAHAEQLAEQAGGEAPHVQYDEAEFPRIQQTIDGTVYDVQPGQFGPSIYQIDFTGPFPLSSTGYKSFAGKTNLSADEFKAAVRANVVQQQKEVKARARDLGKLGKGKFSEWVTQLKEPSQSQSKWHELESVLRNVAYLRAAGDEAVRKTFIKNAREAIAKAREIAPTLNPADPNGRGGWVTFNQDNRDRLAQDLALAEVIVNEVDAGRWGIFKEMSGTIGEGDGARTGLLEKYGLKSPPAAVEPSQPEEAVRPLPPAADPNPAATVAAVVAAQAGPLREGQFKTSKGSVYTVEGTGTQRVKVATGQSFPASHVTTYVSQAMADKVLAYANAGSVVGAERGQIIVRTPKPNAGRHVVEGKSAPAVGLVPVEGWDAGSEFAFHVGHAIVELGAASTPAAAARPAGYGSANKLVSSERAAELKERIKAKIRAQVNALADPELVTLGAELAVYHVEAGARSFAAYAKAMVADLGEGIIPYLRSFYLAARAYPGADHLRADMDGAGHVDSLGEAEIRGMLAGDATADAGQPVVDDATEVPARAGPGVPAGDVGAGADGDVVRLAPADGAPAHGGGQGDPARGTPDPRGQAAEGAGTGTGDGGGRAPRRGKRAERAGAGAAEQPAGAVAAGGGRTADVDPANRNHVIDPDAPLHPLGDAAKVDANLEAVRLLKELEKADRNPTPDEKKTLARYTGWGGLPGALDDTKGAKRHDAAKGWLGAEEAANHAAWEKKWGKRYDAVKEALTPEERDDAKRSTINAHYTSTTVIKAVWDLAARLGFKGGRVLENSAGVGHFLGLEPQALAAASSWTGVERDSISGRILAKLYPRAQILNQPFQDTQLADGSFDLVVGNVPFAKDGPADKRYPKFSLHNYFLARSIDLAKPGGLVVEITSTSTLDGQASLKFREWAAERADLVYAARLPNDAFKANAGTEVTTDVLVYRRRDGGSFPLAQPSRTTLEMPTHDGKGTVDVNEYYHSNPSNILGLVSLEGSMRGADEPAVISRPGTKLADVLAEAVARAPADVTGRSSAEIAAANRPAFAAGAQKENSYQVEGEGKAARVRQVRGRLLVQPDWAEGKGGAERAKRAADWVGVREAAKALINLQVDPGAADAAVEAGRKLLNDRYEAYAKKHGALTGRTTSFLAEDPEYGITAGLEYVDSVPVKVKGKDGAEVTVYRPEIRKADIFTKRTTFPRTEPTSAENVGDAIAISQSWRGTIDMPYVAKLAGVTADAALADAVAKGLVFVDPDGARVVAPDEYLSGNVREKLRRATEAAAGDAGYQRNVDALAKVQPAPLKMADITVRVGSTWMPTHVIAGWIDGLFGMKGTTVDHVPQTGKWIVQWGMGIAPSAANHNTWSGGKIPATDLIHDALHLKSPVAYDEPAKRGDSPTKNPERTVAAQAAQDKLQQHFKKWVQGSEFVPELEKVYNDTYNAVVLRKFQPPTFTQYPGQSAALTLRDHQRAAITRGTIESYYLAHSVGTGKTYTLIGTAMEWRRLGLAKKPLLVAQNATVTQIVESFKRLYPGSNVLSPTQADFSSDNRKRLLARIATGDYDAVVLAHSQFELLGDDPARVRAYTKERIADLEDAIRAQKAAKGIKEGRSDQWSRDPTVKELEKAKEALETRLDKLSDRRTDDLLTFEQLGIDGLLVDEAHRYKKLEFTSQMDNIKGLDRGYSQRGFGLYMKTKFIQERNQGKGVVLASGTPITNTLAEAWNCVRYVRPDLLKQYHVENFDDFATLFTQPVTAMEMSAAGWKLETRLASFTNADELVKLFRSAADVINPEEVDLPRPGLKGGKPETVAIDAHPALRSYMDYLIERYRAWTKLKGKEKREQSHEPLVITGLAKRAALDLRLVDSGAADDAHSKLNEAAARMLAVYKATGPAKGTQAVFGENNRSSDEKFSLWDALTAKLVEGGVPRSEIASIYEHDTKPKRKLLFDKVNAGTVRFVFGSTDKLGVGVNIQERLAALHHLDAPWRPADIEQREGRIIRQGNTIAEVEIMRYGVKNTFDAGLWQRLAMKQRFINQVLRGEIPGRTFDDVGGEVVASFDEAAAFISGDPRVMEKIAGEAQLRKLEALKYQHEADTIAARQKARQYGVEIPRSEREADELRRTLADVGPKLAAETPTVTIEGKEYTGKEDVKTAMEAWAKARLAEVGTHAEGTYSGQGHRIPAGTVSINGVDVETFARLPTGMDGKPVGSPDLNWTYNKGPASAYGVVTTGPGLVRSVTGTVPTRIEEKIDQATKFAARARREIVELQQSADRPFEQQEEFDALGKRVASIDAELAAERVAAEAAKDAADAATAGTAGVVPSVSELLEQDPDQLHTEQAKKDLGDIARRKDFTTYSMFGLGGFNPALLTDAVKAGYHWLYPPVKGSAHAFADASIETRFAEAKKGVQPPPWRERLRAAMTEAWHHLSRPFALLPVGKTFAEAKRILLWLQKQHGVRQHDAVRALDQVLVGMDAKGPSYDLFARVVILNDLAEEVTRQTKRGIKDEDVKLPFGFTPAIVASEKARADAAAAKDLLVGGAVGRRDLLWKAAKKEYADAMRSIGFDAGKKLDRENYFRHQVLAYAALKKRATVGTGEGLHTPTGRGFLKFREGSQLDINADYLQAEFEVLGQMMFDTQVAKGIRQVGNFYDTTKELKKSAADSNLKSALAALAPIAALANKTPQQVFARNYHWKQAKGFGELYESASRGALPDTANGDWADLHQAMADVHDLRDTKVDPDASLSPGRMKELWRYLSWLVKQPSAPKVDAAATSAKSILKGVADKKAAVKTLAGDAYVDWHDLIPDGHVVWQPRPGTQMYLADTIPARLAQELLAGALASANIAAKDIKKVVAKASPFPGFVLPEELATTLDEAFDRPSDNFLSKASAGLLSRWKEWVLLNPRRALKFNIRNMSGDADAVFAFNPKAFKFVPQAARELWANLKQGKAMTPQMRQWFERGGMQTTLTVQELPDINGLDLFKRFDESRGFTPLAKKAWELWWKKSAAVSDGREAILRYANFLSYSEQIKEGKGKPANFGASIPEEVMGLHDHADRAFILSNEVSGAYDSIGEAGKVVRRHWYPFWSFTESNFKRYWRGMKNAARDGELSHTVGRLLLQKAASPYTYVRVGGFALKAMALWGAMAAQNWLFHDDEEKELPPEVRARPHITFGRDKDGKVLYFDRLGALQDILDWFGSDDIPQHVRDWANGRKSLREVASDIALSPPKKAIGGLNPFWKLAAEMLSGKSLFPDPFDPRTIRDKPDYLARQFSVEHEFRALTDRPERPYWQSWADLGIYRADPDQVAYYATLDRRGDYLKSRGKSAGGGESDAPRTQALRQYKLAVRYDDKAAAAKFLAEYVSAGGTRAGLKSSLLAMDPYAGLSHAEARAFYEYLTPTERVQASQARRYYEKVLIGNGGGPPVSAN